MPVFTVPASVNWPAVAAAVLIERTCQATISVSASGAFAAARSPRRRPAGRRDPATVGCPGRAAGNAGGQHDDGGAGCRGGMRDGGGTDYELTRPRSLPDVPLGLTRELFEEAAASYDPLTGGQLAAQVGRPRARQARILEHIRLPGRCSGCAIGSRCRIGAGCIRTTMPWRRSMSWQCTTWCSAGGIIRC